MTADRLTGDCEIDCQTARAYPGRFSECSIGALAAAWDKIAAVDPLDGGEAGKSGTSAPTERPCDSPRTGRSLPNPRPWDTDDSDDDEDRWQDALNPAQAARVHVYFAGAGGSSLGLERAGYTTLGFEYWKPAIDTHRANGMACVEADLSDPTIDATLPACDLAWFSPPCQPFSAAGDRQGEFDDRDGFPWTLRIIAATLPAVVIIENVKGLTFTTHADYFTGVLTSIRRLGYHVEWKVLNCADYGVPQTRERTILVARRDGGPITWPAPTHTEHPGLFTEPWVTLEHVAPSVAGRRGRYRRGAGYVERGGERPDVNPRAPAPTVHTNMATNLQFFPSDATGSQQADAIRVTLPELAALQGFPPDYRWCGSRTTQAKQIANAVPPRLAEVLATANRPALIPQ